MTEPARLDILTPNCHEAYVHLLAKLQHRLHVIDGLPGRYAAGWDTKMRPVPENTLLMPLGQALARRDYDVYIAHSISDLMLVRELDIPKILVFHVSLTARCLEEPNAPPASELREQLHEYLRMTGTLAVAVSTMKRDSWGANCRVIRPAADPNDYSGWGGTRAEALRVANQVAARRERFAWNDHERITSGLPCQLIGHNPEISGSRPSRDWDDLKQLYTEYRAYVHTAGRDLDDGYNMAVIEAMATGMPIVSTSGSDSPVRDGENGFVGDDLDVLHSRLEQLLRDHELAGRLGERARETAASDFSVKAFRDNWQAAIDEARQA